MIGIVKRALARLSRFAERGWNANSQYVDGLPSAQNSVNIFKGDWASKLPLPGVESGEAELFRDDRMLWALGEIGDISGWQVMELGPLEGGHTYMLEKAGAGEVFAVEANTNCYLKCLLTQELFSLEKSKFALADFDAVLTVEQRHFDLVLAAGVLYHLQDPLKTLQNIIRIADNVFIWSHFFDDVEMPKSDPRRTPFTSRVHIAQSGDDRLTYHERSYGGGQRISSFCGGSKSHSVWIERDETVALFEKHGFDVKTAFIDPNHVNGPAACLLARRLG